MESILKIFIINNVNLLALFLTAIIVELLLIWNNKIANGSRLGLMFYSIRQSITRFAIYYFLILFTKLDLAILQALNGGIEKSVLLIEIVYQLKNFVILSDYDKLGELIKKFIKKIE